MSDGTTFLLRQLLARYKEITQHAELGASDHLYELQRRAAECRDRESGDRLLVCFTLAAIFGRLADQADAGPVTAEAARNAFVVLDQPIKECLDFLITPTAGVTGADAATKLVTAAQKVSLTS